MSMGVYIKGMEMPTSCDDCILNNGITCYAVPDYKEDGVVGRTDDRPDWCPLVPVPPHGRLIDADVLKSVLKWHHSIFIGAEDKVEKAQSDALICAISEVVNAPTIIEAEEGE